jgi:hypothetical protein
MKTVTASILIAAIASLTCAVPTARAKDGETGTASVGVSTITFVLHPRISINAATNSNALARRSPFSVTSNLDGGFSVERLAVTSPTHSNHQPSKQSARKTKQIAYVVVPKVD